MPARDAPTSAAQSLALARKAEASGRPVEAARVLRAILTRFPSHAAARDALDRLVLASRRAAGAQAALPARHLSARDPRAALAQADALLRVAPCHPDVHLLRGLALSALGQVAAARQALELAVLLDPSRHDAQMALGVAAQRLDDLTAAEAAFRAAVALRPDDADALNNLGLVLTDADRADEALPLLERAALAGGPPARVAFNLANCLRAMGRVEAALAAYDRALTADPAHWGAANNRGTLLREAGRFDDARAALRGALAIRPDAATTRRNLADLHRFVPDDPELAALRTAHAQATDPQARMQLAFALGKALDDLGEFDAAFAAFAEGNRLRKAAHGYDPTVDARLFSTLQAMPALRPLRVPASGLRPVFVTGMMRSGTSLVEHILAAHPAVAAGGEMEALTRLSLPLLERVAARAADLPTPADLAALRAGYLAALSRRADGRGVVTDKMPANFRWIGLILSALPEARILHLRRDPMAVGWSIFRTCFTARGNGHAWDLVDIGTYTGHHDRLMAHWMALFPDRITVVDYRALTEAPDGPASVIAAAGLDWHPAVADFASAATQVRTASAVQVRQGIYTGSSDRWRDYAAHLGPLARAAGLG